MPAYDLVTEPAYDSVSKTRRSRRLCVTSHSRRLGYHVYRQMFTATDHSIISNQTAACQARATPVVARARHKHLSMVSREYSFMHLHRIPCADLDKPVLGTTCLLRPTHFQCSNLNLQLRLECTSSDSSARKSHDRFGAQPPCPQSGAGPNREHFSSDSSSCTTHSTSPAAVANWKMENYGADTG